MKYFYDTEFHEDGTTIDFISIGMVAEDGREFYAISNEFDTRRVAQNQWLMENVMSSIPHEKFVVADFYGKPLVPDIYVKPHPGRVGSRVQIAQWLEGFIGNDSEPEFWAWYCAYDHVCLAQLWGKMIQLPDNIPMWTNDIKTLISEYERKRGKLGVRLPPQPDGHHNALADAQHNVVRYNYLTALLDRDTL